MFESENEDDSEDDGEEKSGKSRWRACSGMKNFRGCKHWMVKISFLINNVLIRGENAKRLEKVLVYQY